MQEGTVSETSQKEEEPIQQQSVPQEPNVAETKVPAEGHTAAKPEIFHSGGRRGKARHQVISRIKKRRDVVY